MIKKLIVLFVMSSLMMGLFVSCVTSPDDEDIVTSIKIRNSTSITFDKMKIREVGASTWLLDRNIQFPTSSDREVDFGFTKLDSNTQYVIRLEATIQYNRTCYSEKTLYLSQDCLVEFETYTDPQEDTSNNITTLTILNNTGQDVFNHILISRSDSGSWSHYRDFSFTNNIFTWIGIYPALDKNQRYDIQLRNGATGAVRATKRNQSLSQNGLIIFGEDDLGG